MLKGDDTRFKCEFKFIFQMIYPDTDHILRTGAFIFFSSLIKYEINKTNVYRG